jgi:DNA invertase Pin-like site-specific DNA recombinase
MGARARAAIYVRVSTAKTKQADAATFVQNPEVQEQPLRELASQRGWELSRVYSDRASGAAERRPGLDALSREWQAPPSRLRRRDSDPV